MSFLNLPVLAQANGANNEATAGQVLSGMMVLVVMAASLAMIIVWMVRLRETGHALPAAQRGVLRVPLPLTLVAIALSLLMLLMMFLVSMEDQIIPPPVAATPAVAVADESSTQPATPDDRQDAAAPTPSKMTPEKMKSALVNTVVMDLILFFVFGTIVFLSNANGRVRLSDSIAGGAAATRADHEDSSSFPAKSLWPDLNETSTIPQRPRDSVPGHPAISSPASEPYRSDDSYYSPSRDDAFNASADEGQGAIRASEEPFSFLTELWYAGEVFLAAYVPTTFLRIIVVLLTVGLLGEEPGQHPFLEMMNAGVDITVMALILLTAVFFAPIVEEMQFRVVVLGGIAQVGRPMLALSVSSILFAFAHGFPDSLALLPLAFALGYAYLRRRSYITVMLVHFLFNAFNMALALFALL
jgi:hypothetical protein